MTDACFGCMDSEERQTIAALLAKVEDKEEDLRRVRELIGKQDQGNHARSIASRAKILQHLFTLDAQVVCIPNTTEELTETIKDEQLRWNGDYTIIIKIINKTGLVFPANLWQVNVAWTQKQVLKPVTLELAEDLKNTVSKVYMSVTWIDPREVLHLNCSLAAKPGYVDEVLLIRIGRITLDVSYFLHGLLSEFWELDKKFNEQPLYAWETKAPLSRLQSTNRSHRCTLKLPSCLSAAIIWRSLLKHCQSRYNILVNSRKLYLYVGPTRVRFCLYLDYGKIVLQCRDFRTLQCIKRALTGLLANNLEVSIENLLDMVKHNLFTSFITGDSKFCQHNVDAVMIKWRKDVSSLIPI